ncbi:MAG: UDP-N-acetylglucosamine 2-epimerase (hydrolyzing), partial [Lachnospiraceae bacterium]|nr:UDP-N-acetylglucosamine 2-epimerase (hydrolyzing) [Lachnospiraceae bacterium]
ILLMAQYVAKINPDVMVVHGDRIDALAGAIVGILNNILVAHIEGGEITGTVDDSLRHAITKLSHIHFTANEETKLRLLQLGEKDSNIQIIGSPDVDIMLSGDLPDFENIKQRYGVKFEHYGIFMYHPVTTEVNCLREHIRECIMGMRGTEYNYIVVYPNNDLGSQIIIEELEKLDNDRRFLLSKSFPFEEFLVLLKNSDFIIGNSSAGIREACIYGIPCINIGTRQHNRYNPKIMKNIVSVPEDHVIIWEALKHIDKQRYVSYYFGDGHSAELFMQAIKEKHFLAKDIQKVFIDSSMTQRGINNFINEVCF